MLHIKKIVIGCQSKAALQRCCIPFNLINFQPKFKLNICHPKFKLNI